MDVFLVSVFMALLLDCGILIGVQAALVIENMQWTRPLCTFYVWAWVTLRYIFSNINYQIASHRSANLCYSVSV